MTLARTLLASLLSVALSTGLEAQGLVLNGSTSPPPPAPPGAGCTSVTAGNATSYGCLNTQEQALMRQQTAGMDAAGINANTPAPALGLYNQAATREQFGDQFGKSVTPQRPPPATYINPLSPH